MTEIEALLAVDAGSVPPDTLAFFAQEPDSAERRTYVGLSVATGMMALAGALGGVQRPLVALILIASTALAVLAIPIIRPREADEPRGKRDVFVVTARGLIVRDAWGLRSWQFDDLCEAFSWSYDHRPHLILVEHDGRRHAVDYLRFKRGDDLRRVIIDRVKSPLG
jgi:hypothetical protein